MRFASYLALAVLGAVLVAGCGKKEAQQAPAKEQAPATQQKSE
jgi:PBP1b-binding outer membrane lipoprotein LpoB